MGSIDWLDFGSALGCDEAASKLGALDRTATTPSSLSPRSSSLSAGLSAISVGSDDSDTASGLGSRSVGSSAASASASASTSACSSRSTTGSSRKASRSEAHNRAHTAHMRASKQIIHVEKEKDALKAKRDRVDQALSPEMQRLKVCYSEVGSVSTKSKAHDCSRTHVRDSSMSGALTHHIATAQALDTLRSEIAAAEIYPDFFYRKYKWDATEQTMVVDLLLDGDYGVHAVMRSNNMANAWHVLMQSRTYGWLVKGKWKYITVPCPPTVMVGSNNADCLEDALSYKGWQESVRAFEDFMCDRSDPTGGFYESDADGVNLRWYNYKLMTRRPGELSVLYCCGHHQGMRGNGEVVKSHAPFSDHLAGMHAYVSFYRMGNHAMRSTMALENHCSYVDVDYRQAGFSDQSSF